MTNLPRPQNFDAIINAGRDEARIGWREYSAARFALIKLAAHAGLEIVQAKITREHSTQDSELWVQLPSGALAAIGVREQLGRWGNKGFSLYGTAAEQAELNKVLTARLRLNRDTTPGDIFMDLSA